MNNIIRELTLAEQLQAYILDSGVCHHFKITNECMSVNFRNTPDESIKTLLQKWGFKISHGHRDRKFVCRIAEITNKEAGG